MVLRCCIAGYLCWNIFNLGGRKLFAEDYCDCILAIPKHKRVMKFMSRIYESNSELRTSGLKTKFTHLYCFQLRSMCYRSRLYVVIIRHFLRLVIRTKPAPYKTLFDVTPGTCSLLVWLLPSCQSCLFLFQDEVERVVSLVQWVTWFSALCASVSETVVIV